MVIGRIGAAAARLGMIGVPGCVRAFRSFGVEMPPIAMADRAGVRQG